MHVRFKSLAERTFLLELDRWQVVAGVSSQPMWIAWPRAGRKHAPNLFVRLADGTGFVVDVRPLERIDDRASEQFNRTATFCQAAGLRYGVYSPDSLARDANLRFLMRYRDPKWRIRAPWRRCRAARASLVISSITSARSRRPPPRYTT